MLAEDAIKSAISNYYTKNPKAKATDRSYDELYVRSETGLGAEGGTGLTLTGGGPGKGRAKQTAGATATLPHP